MKLWEVIKEIQEDNSKVFYKEMENGKVVAKLSAKTGYLEINLYDKHENGYVIFARAENISRFHIDGNEWKLEEKVSTLNEILEEGYNYAKLTNRTLSTIVTQIEENYSSSDWDYDLRTDVDFIKTLSRNTGDINYIIYKITSRTNIDILKELLTTKCWIGVR